MQDHSQTVTVDASVAKAGAAWSATGLGYVLNWMGFDGWGDFAAFVASVYSCLLIAEWIYKKLRK